MNSPTTPKIVKPEKNRGTATVIKKILRVVVPLGISAVLVVWMFRKLNFKEIGATISHDCDFFWIAMMMFITMLSHIIRGIRWGIQLRAAGVPRMPVVAESVSIFGAYALNLVIPYLGEAWRCVYISRREHVKLSTVVGTDFGDRITDAVVVICLLGLALIVAHPALMKFFDQYPLGRTLEHLSSRWDVWVGIAAAIVLFFLADKIWNKDKFFTGFNTSLKRIWAGFSVLFTMKGKVAYAFLTLGIWTCYFLETYCCFFAFSFTRELIHAPGMAWGLLPGLVVFVFGSFSMAVPSNGGLGPWNIAVMYALMLYGVSHNDAAAYSIVAWGFQAIMLVALGIFSAIYISTFKTKKENTGVTIQGGTA